ncbi:MAG: hypothetical protein IKD09_04730 [Lentisphaeria bacterium]|nr:hypothetical protein [Lentisphaeria bacterium]
MKKTLIKNVKLLDGVNYFGTPGAVIVAERLIEDIIKDTESISDDNFYQIIDGQNQFLTPAFIDSHSHSDLSILSPFELASKKSSGFGIEIVGNCGLSAFPISERNFANLQKIYQKYPTKLNWTSCAEYYRQTLTNPTGTQIYSLTGHNTLHSCVTSYEQRQITVQELKLMQKLLAQSLEEGSLGLSLGLLYTPGRFAEDSEIIALLRTVATYDKIVAVHLKSEGDYLLESLTQMLEFAQKAKLSKLHISHLKTSGVANYHKIDRLLEIIENAPRTHGVSVTFDRYPFCRSLTQLSVAGPDKFLNTPDSKIMEILQNSVSECAEFRYCLQQKSADYFEKIILVATALERYQKFIGMKITQIAQLSNQSVADLILDLIKNDSVNCLAAFETMSEKNMRTIISHPLCMIGSDETARPYDYSLGSSHIRNFGTTSEAIKILRQLGADNSLIIKKLSYFAHERFSLSLSGKIQKGYYGKFNLIDFERIATHATFANPHAPSSGITPLHDL